LKKLAAFICVSLLFGCAAGPVQKSPYALGVAAFKAQDYKTAAAQWSIAADQGDPLAMNNLGFLLSSGMVERDLPRAVALWQTAAAAGMVESQFYLGYTYENGVAVEQDPITAYAWYRCAVQSAQARANAGQAQLAQADQRIGQQAQSALTALAGKLSDAELERGKALAAAYIEKYAAHAEAAAPKP